MNKIQNETFRIRSYGHSELALAYCPHLAPQSAWRKLKSWLRKHPGLQDYFFTRNNLNDNRSFTPREVEMIVEALGEP